VRTTPLLVPYKNDLVWEMRKDELKKKEALKWNNRQSSQENLGKPKFENLQFGWPELQIFMMKQCLEMSLISEGRIIKIYSINRLKFYIFIILLIYINFLLIFYYIFIFNCLFLFFNYYYYYYYYYIYYI